ncbi:MAG TPA: GNAT family N-acetyltransferase [Candidatus Acidoferrales bacterium]|nr:GNAT family N-acetyltransferase [Candidatus Acidoferrales bacterium]
MSGPRLNPDAWLTKRLGKPSFHMAGKVNGLSLEQSPVVQKLAEQNLFVDAKIPVADVASVESVCRMGFSLIDTNVQFIISLSDIPAVSMDGITFAAPEMASAIGEIAATSFSEDRFHRDPAIPDSVADNLKRCWATNFFTGERGDWMVVACIGKNPVGFLQLVRTADGGFLIDLIAVTEDERGRGLACAMIAFARDNCGCEGQAVVGTAIANTRSIGLYEKMGFRLCGAQYVFHHHGATC